MIEISIARLFIKFVKWFTPERAIGIGLLATAALVAYEPLRANSLMQLIVEKGIDATILSHWYAVAGIYLLYKSNDTSSGGLLLAVFPMMITTIIAINIATTTNGVFAELTSSDIARELLIGGLIAQRIFSKLAIELLSGVNGNDNEHRT